MQDTSYQAVVEKNGLLSGNSPEISFWFDENYVAIVWNELVLGYDAHIYKQTQNGTLVHFTTTGGKSLQSASKSARQIILGKPVR